MKMKQRFRNFVGSIQTGLMSERSYMPANSTRYSDEVTLPDSVNNFLNMIDPKYQAQALTWIESEGRRQAAVARQFFTNEINKKFGINLQQDDIFAPMFFKKNPQIAKFKDQIEQEWFSRDLEPRYIPIGKKRINIDKINAHLAQQGKEPMTFGGQSGLIEKMETGEWAVDQFHKDSRNDKQGHDQSLAPGDVGQYRTAGRDIDIIKQKIADARASGDHHTALELKKDLERAEQESQSAGTVTKLGLDNGYIPSTDTKHYGGAIRASVRDSIALIDKVYSDLQKNPDVSFDDNIKQQIKDLIQSGGIKKLPSQQQMELKDVLGAINRQPPMAQPQNPENIIHAKGIIKAIFMDLLSRDPSNPGLKDPSDPKSKEYGTWPSTNPALGIDSKGMLPNARVTISGVDKFDHKDHALTIDDPSPENAEKYADQLANWMVDDDLGLTTNMVKITRGYVKADGTSVRYNPVPIQIADFFSTKKYTKALAALNKLGDSKIVVSYKDQPHEVDPKVALEKLHNVEQNSYQMSGKKVDPEEVGEDESDYGAVNNITQLVNDTPDGQKKYSKDGRFVSLDTPGGTVHARRSNVAMQDGKKVISNSPIWYRIGGNPASDYSNSDPLLTPLKLKTNVGLKGLVPKMKYDKAQTNAEWNKFLSNPMAFGEPKGLDRNGIPDFVNHALGANKDNIFKGSDDPRSMAMNYVAQQIANPSFTYGDFEHKGNVSRVANPRKRDVYDLLGKVIPAEQVPAVAHEIKNALFGQPGEREGPRVLTVHNGPEPFVKPNSVSQGVYDALLTNGYDWRTRKAAGATRSNADRALIGVGQGGDSDEDRPTDVEDKKEVDPTQFAKGDGSIDWDAYAAAASAEDDQGVDGEFEDNPDSEESDEFVSKNVRGDGPTVGGARDDALGDMSVMQAPVTAQKRADWQDSMQGKKRDVTSLFATKLGHDPKFAKEVEPTPSTLPPKQKEVQPNQATSRPPMPPKPIDLDLFGKPRAKPRTDIFDSYIPRLKGFNQWLHEQGGAVYDPNVKIKDGCGFNWWGAAGNPTGVSISGNADTAKSDPTGKGKLNGKSRAKK